MLEKVIMLK